MNRPRPLPSIDPDRFSVSEALSAGTSPTRLRAKHLERAVRGVRSTRPADQLAVRCALFATRLREDAFFSHRTAAALHGIPLPPTRATLDAIEVSVPAPERAPHAAGLLGHQLAVVESELMEIGGLRITTPARTWLDLGKVLLPPDLIAAGDRIIRIRDPLATSVELAEIVAAHPGERGVRRLSSALPLLDGRAESPQESRLRAVLVALGIPRPEVNLDIRDSGGAFLGRGDLVWPRQRLIVEYQGDYHRDRAQWRADMTRRGRLEAAGWRVLEVNADDLARPHELARRIRILLQH